MGQVEEFEFLCGGYDGFAFLGDVVFVDIPDRPVRLNRASDASGPDDSIDREQRGGWWFRQDRHVQNVLVPWKDGTPVMQQVAEGIRRCPQGIHSHLFQGFQQLFEQRQKYDEADITSWLDEMRQELNKNIDRLTRMRAAALSPEDVANITENLTSAGLQEIQFKQFMTSGNKLPVAWSLSASRPA